MYHCISREKRNKSLSPQTINFPGVGKYNTNISYIKKFFI